MKLDFSRARNLLTKGHFKRLFVEELGWDDLSVNYSIIIDNVDYLLEAIAHKRGFVVFQCRILDNINSLVSSIRVRIDKEASKLALEHLIVFTDSDFNNQIWHWAKKEPSKPIVSRTHKYCSAQAGDSLLQKLEGIVFSLEEEELLTVVDVAGKIKNAFDVERVTKRFYEHFKNEHDAFSASITGFKSNDDKDLYTSVMLNRLMFIYFIQKKGFLNGDVNYLRNKFDSFDKCHNEYDNCSFYNDFLVVLFHEGLGSNSRSEIVLSILGRIPYLNGGFFEVHNLEKDSINNHKISIPNKAFLRIFDFFDEYQWNLDERPLRKDNEINPDVLGFIFEKYVNQKQMGAYYTKEDITEYISKNTIIPYILEAIFAKTDKESVHVTRGFVWDLLKTDPKKYINKALRHGIDWSYSTTHIDLGKVLTTYTRISEANGIIRDESQDTKDWLEIEISNTSINVPMSDLNKPASPDYGLPSETWREVIDRRNAYFSILNMLSSGQVTNVDQLVKHNLNIRQFAQDIIESTEDPILVSEFWEIINHITILDPTCGSGAFLFAALNVLEPLYEACLNKMQVFIDDNMVSNEQQNEYRQLFKKILFQSNSHTSLKYFILKNIILNNLYGVDISKEAVEICKLRLFLKLVAQVEPDFNDINLGIEPLPDIDFNIRAGNSLVGYANYQEIYKTLSRSLDFHDSMSIISTKLNLISAYFEEYRNKQTTTDDNNLAASKLQLNGLLNDINDRLNLLMAKEYCVFREDFVNEQQYQKKLESWYNSHLPFNWLAEFYSIVEGQKGFDIIIGNPPYVQYSEVAKQYKVMNYLTEGCGNLYAITFERSIALAKNNARIGLIIPVASISTDTYNPLRQLWKDTGYQYISSYNDRPGKLFDNLEHIRLAIVLHTMNKEKKALSYTTSYLKWKSEARDFLFQLIRYWGPDNMTHVNSFPKLNNDIERTILSKLQNINNSIGNYVNPHEASDCVYYTRKIGGFVQILDFIPEISDESGTLREPSELKVICFNDTILRNVVLSILNSSLFYWYLTITSDCRNLNKRDIFDFYFEYSLLSSDYKDELSKLSSELMLDFKNKSKYKVLSVKNSSSKLSIQNIYPKLSKSIIDKIDSILANIYGLSNEEAEFIINFDYKFRMSTLLDIE